MGISCVRDYRGSRVGTLFQKSNTRPDMSMYGPEWLFRNVIGVEGGHLVSWHIIVGWKDGSQILVLENDPMED